MTRKTSPPPPADTPTPLSAAPQAPAAAPQAADNTVPASPHASASHSGKLAGLSSLMAAALAACGGGGDGDGSAIPPAPTPGVPPAPGVPLPGGPSYPSPTPSPGPAPAPGPAPSPSPTPGPAPSPTPRPTPITAAEAARFLLQAQLSASPEEIADVQAKGYSAWLDEQMRAPSYISGWDWLMQRGYNRAEDEYLYNIGYTDHMMWNQLMQAGDGLRKRVALAWSEIMVVSANGIEGQSPSFCMAAYWDLLNRNAFGNYRTLLEEITLNPAMGYYLDTLGNAKENMRTGRRPDENYAREVMQLFSIGLYQLNQDGSRVGGGIETYGAADVSELARIFTGYDLDETGNVKGTRPLARRNPMKLNPARHSNLSATFLGQTVPAGADGAARLKQALDIIFNHANVGPFIGRQLIQRLVTSNPSPAYIARVAGVFNNDGAGVRGNLAAVTKAVLLDPEARQAPELHGPNWGKLREPMLRFVQWARTFKARGNTAEWRIWSQSSASTGLNQSPLRSPSVFNFFRPGYVPPGTALATSGHTAPEFQITDENSVASYLNFMRNVIAWGYGSPPFKLEADYTPELQLVNDPQALLDRLNLLLTGNQLSAATLSLIRDAVASIRIPASNNEWQRKVRVWSAIFLVMASPDYLVQK